MELTLYFELHLSLENDNQLVGGMRKVFPTLPGRVRPQFATEATGGPLRGDGIVVGTGNNKVSRTGQLDRGLIRHLR